VIKLNLISKSIKTILRIFVIVLVCGAIASNLMEYTFSATTQNNPNVLVTINDDGSISHNGNLFDGQLYPATEDDAEKGIGGINGVIRIENQFKKIDVDNLAIGIKNIVIKNDYAKNAVFNSFLTNIKLKIEKGNIFSFNKTLIDYTKLSDILYETESDKYHGYILDSDDKFSLDKGDVIDLKYSLYMDLEAGNELESVTAYMPIYINLKESYVDDGNDDDGDDDDDGEEVVIIEDSLVPIDKLNKIDHFQYIQGYPDNTVRPEGLITREEVATVFYRLLDPVYRISISTGFEGFSDVSDNRWSIKHIATLANGKIIEGYPNGSFKPGDSITRAELAAIASRFDNLSSVQGNSFTDIEEHWAIDYINSSAAKGWVKGYPDGSFKPDQYITRAEFVTLVNNVLGRNVHKENILGNIKVFPDLTEDMWYYEAMVEAINSHINSWDENLNEVWIEIIYPTLDL
jgi:hypothetical protein